MGGTRTDATEWSWSHVPKLLVQSLLYPIRAGRTPGLLKSVLLGGLLISPFMVILFGLGRAGLSAAWTWTMDAGGNTQAFLILIVLVAVLAAVVPLGYFLRVVQRVSVADEELPTFGNRRRLAILGIQVATIYFFYLIFPLDILIRFIGIFSEAIPLIQALVPETALVYVVFLYLYPAAVASFAEEERLLSALPQRLKSTLWSRTYTVGALTSGLIGGAIYVIRFQVTPGNLPILLLPVGVSTFYLLVAQHYVIGRTWSAIAAERSASEPLEASSELPVPNGRIHTGELRDRGVLSTEDAAAIRGRFETAVRDPDPDVGEQLEALRTLYDRGVLTEEEYEEKRREITSESRSTGPETESGDERSVAPEDRTRSAEVTTDVDATEVGRGARPIDGVGTVDDEDTAGDVSDRRERFAMLRQLYGQDVFTAQEYDAKRRELGPDHDPAEVPGDSESALAERFRTLRGLYDQGLLTEEEYAEKRRDLLEEL